MKSPIEAMINKACGTESIKKTEGTDPSDVLLRLADASTTWYRDKSSNNFENMGKAIEAWINVGG